MSRDKLVDEYVDGALSRRKFIHGLVGLGVTAAAAVAFADALTAQSARAVTVDDYYGTTTSVEDYYGTTTTVAPSTTTAAPSTAPAISLGAATVNAGGSVTLSGEKFKPESDVEIELHSDPVKLAKVKSDAAGKFTTLLNIPASTAPGKHKIVAKGLNARGAAAELSADIEVLAARLTATPTPARPSFTG